MDSIPPFAALPLPVGMLLAALAGLVAGAAVNWAAYSLAFDRRLISPWSPAHPDAPPRKTGDRVPILGWLALSREAGVHGPRFWMRPLAVEVLMAAGFAALYWWEVGRQGLVAEQFAALGVVGGAAPTSATLATFASHAILITLMAAASLVDFDEKTIPSAVTDVGTLVGLAIATLAPMALLPQVGVSAKPQAFGVAIPGAVAAQTPGAVVVEPVTLAAPLEWPAELGGAPRWQALALGLACYALWCFALTPRIWRTRHGIVFGLRVLLARLSRELRRPPLVWAALGGFAAITAVWYRGGPAWVGLLTALVGMIGASAMIWAVRIVGSAAIGREAMGFGDVTLMMMIGAFLGWQAGIIIFFLAPLPALVAGVWQVVLSRDDEIPYGPFLCLATLVVMVGWARWWHAPPGGLQIVFELGVWIVAILGACIVLLGVVLMIWQRIKAMFA